MNNEPNNNLNNGMPGMPTPPEVPNTPNSGVGVEPSTPVDNGSITPSPIPSTPVMEGNAVVEPTPVNNMPVGSGNEVVMPGSTVPPVPPSPQIPASQQVVTPNPSVVNNGGNDSQVVGSPNVSNAPSSPAPKTATPNPAPVNQSVEPAYTNPQELTGGPMPGFENSGEIGTTPPISLNQEKQPKKKTNKTLFIAIVLVAIAAVGLGVYYVLTHTDLLSNQGKGVTITTLDLQLNVNDPLPTAISDFATVTGTQTSNCNVDTSSVDMTKEGVYQFKVTCGGVVRTGTLIVADNSELQLETIDAYKSADQTVIAKDFVKAPVDGITYEFADEETTNIIKNNEPGEYTIKIKATKGSKTAEAEAKLVILAETVKGRLICASKVQNISNTSIGYFQQLQFIIGDSDTEKNIFTGVAYEFNAFKFGDETEYETYKLKYQENKTLTINDITGNVLLNDEQLMISMVNRVDEDALKEQFGNSNKYSALKKAVEAAGYECSYSKEGE